MKRLLVLSLALFAPVAAHGADGVPLSSLDLSKAKQGWNKPKADKAVTDRPLAIRGKKYAKGFGTHSESSLWIDLGGDAERFTAEVGLDDGQNGSGSAEFFVVGDEKLLWRSGVLTAEDQAKAADVPLKGVKRLLLFVGDGGDGTGNDHANWADARITGGKPATIDAPEGVKLPDLSAPVSTRTYISKIPKGYDATIFAKPPMINYPVQVCATGEGRVFVAVDQNGSLDKAPHRGKILLLTDANNDGEADKVDAFVPDVDSPRGLYYDGATLYCLHPPTLTAYRDTDGDGKADQQQDIATGLGYGLDKHPADHTSNGIRMGIDGWLYMAIGDFGIPDGKGTDGSSVVLRGGGVLRIRPDGSDLEVYVSKTRNIYDVAQDPYLNGFIRDNTNDGDGWNTRLSFLVGMADHGYPSLYKRFAHQAIAPLADYGGGSAVGSLFLHEPGFPGEDGNALLTCDWGTSWIYQHHLTADGAGWLPAQTEWARVDRVTDIDVDGNSRLYAASWRGAVFTYNGENVGAIVRLSPNAGTRATFPDLAKASDADLVKVHLASASAVCRQQAQSEILRRKSKPAFKTELTALAKSASAPLYVRVAAIFTAKQLLGEGSHDLLLALAKEPAVQEWALRALADRKGQLKGVPTEPFVQALADGTPRVKVQALIGLARLGRPDTAKAVVPLTAVKADAKGAELIIPHTAVRTLTALQGIEPCLAAISSGASAEQVDGALWALSYLHDARTVKGLVGKLEGAAPDLKKKLLTTLVRLYVREGEWDKKHWWGTRPEHQGPYFQRATWDGTPAIEAALKDVVAKGPADLAQFIIEQVEFHKLKIDGLGQPAAVAATKGDKQADAALLAKAQAAAKQADGKVIANLGYEEVMATAMKAKGDAKLGEELFARQGCIACHTVSKDGPQKGPYLGEVAKQYGRAELIESIVRPNAKMSQGFTTRWFETKDGDRQMGFVTSEGAELIELRNIVGMVIEIPTAEIVKRGEEKTSMMPEGLVNNLKPEELAAMLAYFEKLVGK